MDARTAQNLKPPEMVALLRTGGRAAFEKAVGAPILLVRIDDPSSDFAITLEAALEDSSTLGGRQPEPSMGFDTVVGSLPASIESFLLASRIARSQFSGAELARRLARIVHIAVPLHKRAGASNVFSERISVGRARTNDIVLRHHSVSKFQAWFERDEDDRFVIAGGKTTNATLMNGIEIPRASPVSVAAGDEIRFGDVSAVFCTPGLLWDSVMLGAPLGETPRPPARPGMLGDPPKPPARPVPPPSLPPSSRGDPPSSRGSLPPSSRGSLPPSSRGGLPPSGRGGRS